MSYLAEKKNSLVCYLPDIYLVPVMAWGAYWIK